MAANIRCLTITVVVALLLGLGAVSCGEGPKVVQGTVTGYDTTTKRLVLAEENVPDSILTIDLSAAEVGEEPRSGDKIRVAYRETSGSLQGIRVMSLGHEIH